MSEIDQEAGRQIFSNFEPDLLVERYLQGDALGELANQKFLLISSGIELAQSVGTTFCDRLGGLLSAGSVK